MKESIKGGPNLQSAHKRRFLRWLGLAPAAAVAVAVPVAIATPAHPRPEGPLVRDSDGRLWVVLQRDVKQRLFGGGVEPGGAWYLVARPDGGLIFEGGTSRRCLMHRTHLREVDHGAR